MQYQIGYKKVHLFIVTSVLLVFVALGSSYGNSKALAQRVYNKHSRVFQRDGVQDSLPDVLKKLKSPDIQPLLTPVTIRLIVDNPDLLKRFAPDTPDALIELIKKDAQVKRLMNDADFHKVLQSPAAIDALAVLISRDARPTRPTTKVRVVEIGATRQNVKLRTEGIELNTQLAARSTHNLTIIVRNAQGNLLRGAKATLSVAPVGNSQATATFKPRQATTNQFGRARVQVAFGQKGGDIRIKVAVTPAGQQVQPPTSQKVQVVEIGATRRDLKLRAMGIQLNTPLSAGSTHNLTIILRNAQGNLLRGTKLSLFVDRVGNSQATTTFNPQQVTTNQFGRAKVELTFGQKGGDIRIKVAVGKKVRVVEIGATSQNVQLRTEGIQLNTLLAVGSTHNLTIIVRNANGNLLRGTKLSLSVNPVGNSQATATFTPQQATTNRFGRAKVELTFGQTVGDIGIKVAVMPESGGAYARRTIVVPAAPSAEAQLPVETTLLSNYPNPFNPETWIAYHLAAPAEVTLRIYAVDGKLVRTLALGHQAAGYYQNKSRAAYWDGRNAVGECVVSGVYFYTLTAGDFLATGKMLIMK